MTPKPGVPPLFVSSIGYCKGEDILGNRRLFQKIWDQNHVVRSLFLWKEREPKQCHFGLLILLNGRPKLTLFWTLLIKAKIVFFWSLLSFFFFSFISFFFLKGRKQAKTTSLDLFSISIPQTYLFSSQKTPKKKPSAGPLPLMCLWRREEDEEKEKEDCQSYKIIYIKYDAPYLTRAHTLDALSALGSISRFKLFREHVMH